MLKRSIVSCVVFSLFFLAVRPVQADLSTRILDPLFIEMAARVAVAPDPLPREMKKEIKVYLKTIKLSGKNSPTLDKDLKFASKIVKTLLKVVADDPALDAIIAKACEDFEAEVASRRISLSASAASLPGGKGQAKANKFIGKAQTLEDASRLAALVFLKLKILAKAAKTLVKADKVIAKIVPLPPDGNNGGNGDCPASPLGLETRGTFTWTNGRTVTTNALSASLVLESSTEILALALSGQEFNPPSIQSASVFIEFAPRVFRGVGSYEIRPLAEGVDVVVRYHADSDEYEDDNFVSTVGTVDITEFDAEAKTVVGSFQGTVENLQGDSLTLSASFDFCYLGGLSGF